MKAADLAAGGYNLTPWHRHPFEGDEAEEQVMRHLCEKHEEGVIKLSLQNGTLGYREVEVQPDAEIENFGGDFYRVLTEG